MIATISAMKPIILPIIVAISAPVDSPPPSFFAVDVGAFAEPVAVPEPEPAPVVKSAVAVATLDPPPESDARAQVPSLHPLPSYAIQPSLHTVTDFEV
jgi:hypothetical protein